MKATKLFVITIAFIAVTVASCDEAMMVDDIITDRPVEGILQAELKQIEGDSADTSTNPVNRKKILNWPGEDATDEKIKEWREMVVAASVNVNVLDISGCTPNPLVLEVGLGESIEIKNPDTVSHTLTCRGNRITIPAGGSRGIIVSEFAKVKGDGTAGYNCSDRLSGIFRINARLTVKPSEKQRYISFKVIGFLFSDGSRGPGLEGVKVTTLDGTEVTQKTAIDGSISLKRNLPLTLRLEKEGYITTEVTVTEEGEEILLPSEEPREIVIESLIGGDTIISDGSIDQETLVEVRDSMDLSRTYAKEQLGINPPGVNVFISANADWLTGMYLAVGQLHEGLRPGKMQSFGSSISNCQPAGEGSLAGIFIPLCNDGWDRERMLAHVLAHEWWHARVQYYLLNASCCSDNYKMQMVGPEWLFEGTAEVWAGLVLNDFAIHPAEEVAWRHRNLRGRVPVDFNLLDFNTRRGFRESGAGYKFGARDLAAWVLMETAGLHSFLDFYKRLGAYFATEAAEIGLESTNQSDQMREFRNNFFDPPERYRKLNEIFQSAFGQTMEAFAEEFRDSLQ